MFLALWLLLTPPADWATLIPQVKPGIVRIEMLAEGTDDPGVCSGVVIAPEYLVSAAHCFDKPLGASLDITVNGRHAAVARSNRLLDLAVVRFTPKDEVVIPLAPKTPPAGTEIMVAGFGFGVEDLAIQFGRISQPYNKETRAIWVNADLLFGDSGGGLLDSDGRLVGVNSAVYSNGPAHMAAAVPVEVLRDFLEPYLPAR